MPNLDKRKSKINKLNKLFLSLISTNKIYRRLQNWSFIHLVIAKNSY